MASIPPMEITVDTSKLEEALGLAKFSLAAAGVDGHKLIVAAAKRLADLGETDLAIRIADHFEIKTIEVERPGNPYL